MKLFIIYCICKRNKFHKSCGDVYNINIKMVSTFANIESILKIVLTIPFCNASSEWTFSVLKRVKNYLRNSISQALEYFFGNGYGKLCYLNV